MQKLSIVKIFFSIGKNRKPPICVMQRHSGENRNPENMTDSIKNEKVTQSLLP